MRFLLDTHTVIWYLEDNPALSKQAKNVLQSPENELFVSNITLWELAIKISIGKLSLSYPLEKCIEELQSQEIELLHFDVLHILKVQTMPFHHKDPFDRMLIAQALVDNLTFVSNEVLFDNYGVSRLW